MSLEVSPLLAYDTQATIAEAKRLHAKARQAQPVHQDPRHQRRPAGDRGGDLRRRPGERHAAVLDRPVSRRGRRLHEGPGAAHRGRPRRPTCARSPRVFVSRWDRAVVEQGARRRCATRSASRWPAGLQRLPRPAARRSLAAAGECRRAAAAAAVRQHQHQGPERARHAVHHGARGAEHGQHHAGRDAARLRRSWAGRRARCRATAAMPKRCWPRTPRPASTSTRWRHSCKSDGAKAFVESWQDLLGVDRRQEQGAGLMPEETAEDRADRDARPWQALAAHHAQIKDVHLRTLFADDPAARERFTAEGAGLVPRLFEEPHHRRDHAPAAAARRGARRGEAARCDVRGDKINMTEHRAVLHVALRAPRDAVIEVDGRNVVPDVHAVLDRMAEFADACAPAPWTGHTGKRIRNVVNIGIGGSYLGPEMAYLALRRYSDRVDDLPLRLQRRRRRLHRGDAGSRRGGDPVHRLVEDLHDARDDDQRGHRARAGWWRSSARSGRRQALRRRLDQHRRRSTSSASTRPTCSASGTGWAAATRWTARSACRP